MSANQLQAKAPSRNCRCTDRTWHHAHITARTSSTTRI